MKICVIFTGGTIGSTVKNGWMVTDQATSYTLLEEYRTSDTEFVAVTPYTALSENLSSEKLILLQKAVEQELARDFDGIIVTHGTDTLQYAAVSVEYALGRCRIPVLFVSSDYPLEDPRANGKANFRAAVEFIRRRVATGVFVSYRNSGEERVDFHVPSHLKQHGECNSDLTSILSPFASLEKDDFREFGLTANRGEGLGVIPFGETCPILTVESTPGNPYSYELSGVKAVILKPYHSATLDTANPGLLAFCQRAKAAEVPVFVPNVKPGPAYESAKCFEEFHIVPLPYGTFVSAYIKIWAGISLGKELTSFALSPLTNEILS